MDSNSHCSHCFWNWAQSAQRTATPVVWRLYKRLSSTSSGFSGGIAAVNYPFAMPRSPSAVCERISDRFRSTPRTLLGGSLCILRAASPQEKVNL